MFRTVDIKQELQSQTTLVVHVIVVIQTIL